MIWLVALGFTVLGALAARGSRTAYLAFVILGLSFMPARAGFHFSPQACDLRLSVPLAIRAIPNYNHILLFAGFFIMTRAQFPADAPRRFLKAAAICLAMGIAVELEQALVGRGHCRIWNLIPDGVGIGLGATIMTIWDRIRR